MALGSVCLLLCVCVCVLLCVIVCACILVCAQTDKSKTLYTASHHRPSSCTMRALVKGGAFITTAIHITAPPAWTEGKGATRKEQWTP